MLDVYQEWQRDHAIEVPCFERDGRPLLRLSVQGYNGAEDVERLVTALPVVLR